MSRAPFIVIDGKAFWGMSAQLNSNPIVARLNVETYLHELMLRPAG